LWHGVVFYIDYFPSKKSRLQAEPKDVEFSHMQVEEEVAVEGKWKLEIECEATCFELQQV